VGPWGAGGREEAAWADWHAGQGPPFARDALGVLAWIKRVDAARGGVPVDSPPSLAQAAERPWRALPWWHEPVADADRALLPRAVAALFQVHALAPDFRTLPSDPPQGRLWLDVDEARLRAEPRRDGAYAEPAWWPLAPSLGR